MYLNTSNSARGGSTVITKQIIEHYENISVETKKT